MSNFAGSFVVQAKPRFNEEIDLSATYTWVTRMRSMPATVVSSTLQEPIDWLGGATVGSGDGIEVVAEPGADGRRPGRPGPADDLPRAHRGDGVRPVFEDAADFDLELIESRTFDGHTQELTYRPTLH